MSTKTIYIQIGNSDDKLTQARWSDFLTATHLLVDAYSSAIHFSGYSAPGARWQNACWCLVPPSDLDRDTLRRRLIDLAAEYGQDSIAWAEATTEFITPAAVSHG